MDTITAYYRAIDTRKEFEIPDDISEKEESIFDAVTSFLGLRVDLLGYNPAPKRKSFSSVLKTTSKEEIYLACLRKIKKSAIRWNKRNGENGYLNFVKNYV